jgi:hypothetical protein
VVSAEDAADGCRQCLVAELEQLAPDAPVAPGVCSPRRGEGSCEAHKFI